MSFIKTTLISSLFAISCANLSAFEAQQQKEKTKAKVTQVKKSKEDNPDESEPKKIKKPMLRHVVAFKFKEKTSDAQIKELVKAFRGLKKKIPQIASFETGTNNSPENLNKGHTHAFILTFNSEEDRDAYLIHPDHKEFGKLVGPIVDDVFVIDFWAK
jgi:flagellar biosynthesis component FlhA